MSSSTRQEAVESSSSFDEPSVDAAQKAFTNGLRRAPQSMKLALSQAPSLQQHDSSGNITEEDYDHLKLDPYALVPGAHGGGFEQQPSAEPHLRFPSGTLAKNEQTGDYVLQTRDENVHEIFEGKIEIVSLPSQSHECALTAV